MTDLVYQDIVSRIAESSDGEALLADGFDEALIGVVEGWFGNSRRTVALYDLAICLRVVTSRGMSEEEAAEYFFSTVRMSHETSAGLLAGAR